MLNQYSITQSSQSYVCTPTGGLPIPVFFENNPLPNESNKIENDPIFLTPKKRKIEECNSSSSDKITKSAESAMKHKYIDRNNVTPRSLSSWLTVSPVKLSKASENSEKASENSKSVQDENSESGHNGLSSSIEFKNIHDFCLEIPINKMQYVFPKTEVFQKEDDTIDSSTTCLSPKGKNILEIEELKNEIKAVEEKVEIVDRFLLEQQERSKQLDKKLEELHEAYEKMLKNKEDNITK
jgi:hypothetical protein